MPIGEAIVTVQRANHRLDGNRSLKFAATSLWPEPRALPRQEESGVKTEEPNPDRGSERSESSPPTQVLSRARSKANTQDGCQSPQAQSETYEVFATRSAVLGLGDPGREGRLRGLPLLGRRRLVFLSRRAVCLGEQGGLVAHLRRRASAFPAARFV